MPVRVLRMTSTASGTDKQLGLSLVFGIAVVAGSLAMLVAPGDSLGAAGFAVAIFGGLALIGTLHLS